MVNKNIGEHLFDFGKNRPIGFVFESFQIQYETLRHVIDFIQSFKIKTHVFSLKKRLTRMMCNKKH